MHKKMKLLPLIALTTLMACGSAPADDQGKQKSHDSKSHENKTHDATKSSVKTGDIDLNKVSEALGHFIGRNLNTSGIHFDLENIIKGMREGATGKPAPMTDAEYEKAMAELQQTAYDSVAETNMDAANKFIKENANVKGVVVAVPDQLQYTILQEGHGPVVPEHGTPLINYTGKYLDGTVFGSSESAGGPISVPIDQTIPGFSKGIAGMKEGEKRRLFVHPDAGYGRSGQLPPNSLLIFDIEVVKAASPEKESALDDKDLDEDNDFDDDEDSDENQNKDANPAKPMPPKANNKV